VNYSQDVDLEMGPTVYLPGTHTKAAHTEFYGGNLEAGRERSGLRIPPIPEEFLKGRRVQLGTLRAGDVAIYNQQVRGYLQNIGISPSGEPLTRFRRSF